MKNVVFAFALVLAPTMSFAKVFECDATNTGNGGWIPPKIFVEIKGGGTEALAFDGFIKQVHDKPIEVEIKKTKETTYRLDWKLRGVKTSNAGSGILSHTLILDTSTGAFKMRGRLHGADNVISGSGKCKAL